MRRLYCCAEREGISVGYIVAVASARSASVALLYYAYLLTRTSIDDDLVVPVLLRAECALLIRPFFASTALLRSRSLLSRHPSRCVSRFLLRLCSVSLLSSFSGVCEISLHLCPAYLISLLLGDSERDLQCQCCGLVARVLLDGRKTAGALERWWIYILRWI